jgi:glutamate synthase domain-containing protein 1
MCGIVGLHLLDPDLEPRLGELLAAMLVQMTDRGPDSSGVALYGDIAPEGQVKYSCRASRGHADWEALADALGLAMRPVTHGTAVLTGAPGRREALEAAGIRVVSTGAAVEVFKEVGLPAAICEQFGITRRHGYQGVGHTRLATESAITTDGSHPFSTHDDLCVVHNGSFSNYFSVRRDLEAEGETFLTENDTEVAARLLGHEMGRGRDLGDALEILQKEMDGFYTLLCATRDQFAVVRDAISCKPAVVAVHPRYVAMASEYRALAELPDVEQAEVFEPTPTEIYVWTRP